MNHNQLCEVFSHKFDFDFSVELFERAFLETTKNDQVLELIDFYKKKGLKI